MLYSRGSPCDSDQDSFSNCNNNTQKNVTFLLQVAIVFSMFFFIEKKYACFSVLKNIHKISFGVFTDNLGLQVICLNI